MLDAAAPGVTPGSVLVAGAGPLPEAASGAGEARYGRGGGGGLCGMSSGGLAQLTAQRSEKQTP
jgi:hypothetical protein